jgi:hypothetical protein
VLARPAERIDLSRRGYREPAHRVPTPAQAAQEMADHERRHRLAAPIVRAVLTRLLGWRYDASPAAHAWLAAQLPLVAFRLTHETHQDAPNRPQ